MAEFDSLTTIARVAADYVRNGDTVGLGSGRAATRFVEVLGERVRDGLKVQAIATSQATAEVARRVGIPLFEPDDIPGAITIAVDGADDVDPALNLIKGKGGALVRERMVASRAHRFVILVGADKLVPALGRTPLPVEVVPFAHEWTKELLPGIPVLRFSGSHPYVTDNGNYIFDCDTGPMQNVDLFELERQLLYSPGVVGTGLFLGITEEVIVGRDDSYEILKAERKFNW